MKTTLALLALVLAGCSSTPDWDARLGHSSRQARAAQLIDPAASSRTPPPATVDGKAVAGSLRDYADTFDYVERPPRTLLPQRINPR
ncbi:pilus assembly protein [Azohydromonas aeria]|uniref:pilus assembly protein n=1 Tax=Azohydromonas aeria TaxID=2590212 RepID=UPI0012FBB8B4|nr:pilus assembly protein [Azohydromonas aeria]